MNTMLTTAQVARIMQLSESRVRQLAQCHGKAMGAEKMGPAWVYNKEKLEQWLKRPRPVGRPKKDR
jgi:hypothetical protein